MLRISLASLLVLGLACGGDDDIDSDTEARWAYLGFDTAVDKAINLGFDGFNAANSANIDDQNGVGDVAGSMVVGGQADQGSSPNKQMRLNVALVDYNDGEFDDPNTTDDEEALEVIYNTETDLYLELSLRNIPNGTLTGTLTGSAFVTGDLDAEATFDLAMTADIEEDPSSAGDVIRSPGTLTITGTVTSADGIYNVNTSL